MQKVYRISEIDEQTLRAYSTHCTDEKKVYKHEFRNASFPSYKHFLFTIDFRHVSWIVLLYLASISKQEVIR